MDILAIAPHTATVKIRHPATGVEIGLSVECVSLESDQVKTVERQFKNAALRSVSGGAKTDHGSGGMISLPAE